MAHNTLTDGTAYEIIGGKDLVDGTAYKKKKGRTLVDGTGYDINFGMKVMYTGQHTIYGSPTKGWIEMKTSGILTIEGNLPCDIFVIGAGSPGEENFASVSESGSEPYRTVTYHDCHGGDGGDGGAWKEDYKIALDAGPYNVRIEADSIIRDSANNVVITSSGGAVTGKGGTGARVDGTSKQNSSTWEFTGTTTPATDGTDGHTPFDGHEPLNDGRAQYPLGAGGGGGGQYYWGNGNSYTPTIVYLNPGEGGSYGGGRGARDRDPNTELYDARGGSSNTGSGGGGAATLHGTPGAGGSGIAIVRWGFR